VKELPRAANYYYISGDLYYKRDVIKLVCAHTISRNNDLCQKMIVEIIDAYKDYDKVIMCGDWNSGNYKKFVNTGFSLANDGSYKTYPQGKYPLDNIIVKGLKIIDIRMIETDLSDHCPLVCKISFE
jgi:endonuclease/exonuclease/phosphatase (EEP) superfamily protein YafD